MGTILYAAMCVLFPVGWGLVVVFASNKIEAAVARRAIRRGEKPRPPPGTQYYI